MNETRALLLQTAERLFGDLASDRNASTFDRVWPVLDEAGFPLILTSEAGGGFGGDWQDATAVLRLAGYHALGAPLAEAMIARLLIDRARLRAPGDFVSVASSAVGVLRDGRFTGMLTGIGWGRYARSVVATLDGQAFLVSTTHGANLVESVGPAGEARDSLHCSAVAVDAGICALDAFALGALSRAALIAGALDGALERSIAFANDRVQFGKPIGKFQAVQQNLAVFAEEAAAVNCAFQSAATRASRGDDAGFEIAAAKLRANMAAGTGAAIAHQVHGAIGFTRDYDLHHYTRRLVSWSSEFGSERYWAEKLGGLVAAAGDAAFWPTLTARSDLG